MKYDYLANKTIYISSLENFFNYRLGEYQYYDMDAVIASALQLVKNEFGE